MKNPNFTKYNDVPYQDIIKKALKNKIITPRDGELIKTYIEDKISKGDIEEARAQRLATYLSQWRRFIKVPYEKMTYKDLLAGIASIRKGSSMHGRPYSPDTIRGLIKTIKTFTRWLARQDIVKITRDDLDEIKYPREITDSIKSNDLLKPEQIEAMIGMASSMRDKAIIAILADTGLRPVDVAGLKWRDLDFNQQRVKIQVIAEKTNLKVTCYVILHKSWLVELRKIKNNGRADDYIFLDDDGEPISYIAIDRMLKRAANKAGVKFPRGAVAKLFRAMSITEKELMGYSPAAISRLHWGTDSSKMLSHYSKLNDQDTEREALERSGAEKIEKPEPIRPDLCPNPNCRELISPGVKFCPECGEPITPEAKASHADLAAILDREIIERLEKLEALTKAKGEE